MTFQKNDWLERLHFLDFFQGLFDTWEHLFKILRLLSKHPPYFKHLFFKEIRAFCREELWKKMNKSQERILATCIVFPYISMYFREVLGASLMKAVRCLRRLRRHSAPIALWRSSATVHWDGCSSGRAFRRRWCCRTTTEGPWPEEKGGLNFGESRENQRENRVLVLVMKNADMTNNSGGHTYKIVYETGCDGICLEWSSWIWSHERMGHIPRSKMVLLQCCEALNYLELLYE